MIVRTNPSTVVRVSKLRAGSAANGAAMTVAGAMSAAVADATAVAVIGAIGRHAQNKAAAINSAANMAVGAAMTAAHAADDLRKLPPNSALK